MKTSPWQVSQRPPATLKRTVDAVAAPTRSSVAAKPADDVEDPVYVARFGAGYRRGLLVTARRPTPCRSSVTSPIR